MGRNSNGRKIGSVDWFGLGGASLVGVCAQRNPAIAKQPVTKTGTTTRHLDFGIIFFSWGLKERRGYPRRFVLMSITLPKEPGLSKQGLVGDAAFDRCHGDNKSQNSPPLDVKSKAMAQDFQFTGQLHRLPG
jgi:hypothetical protein